MLGLLEVMLGRRATWGLRATSVCRGLGQGAGHSGFGACVLGFGFRVWGSGSLGSAGAGWQEEARSGV